MQLFQTYLLAFLITPFSIGYANSVSHFQEQAISLKLSKEKQWLRLVHYEKTMFGGHKSQADGRSFFLASNGKRDPHAELMATIEGFYSEADQFEKDQHPLCRFPARFVWLHRKLKFPKETLPVVKCPGYKEFLDLHPTQSVSLVFSSYHLNVPASAFGHTLLRLNKKAHAVSGKHHELLDYGINYAANYTTTNPFIYTILGFTGGFQGIFSSIPYFYKIREYNDFESRDIWSYLLDLNEGQIELMLAHMWELGNTYFDYWYLTENCSYHMLSILEVANVDWDLLDKLPMTVIPGETMKVAYQTEGMVKSISYRPSIRTKFLHSLGQLSPIERDVLREIIDQEEVGPMPSALDKHSKAKILDTAIDYMDFHHARDVLLEEEKIGQVKRRYLVARSKLVDSGVSKIISPPMDRAPHTSHPQQRLRFQAGQDGEESRIYQFNFRFSYHDYLDPPDGMPSFSQIEMMNVGVRYYEDEKKSYLHEMIFARVLSLNPWGPFTGDTSFHAEFGMRDFNNPAVTHQNAPYFNFGLGASLQFLGENMIYLALEAQLAVDSSFHRSWLFPQAGPTLLLILRPHKKVSAAFSTLYARSFNSSPFSFNMVNKGEFRWHFRSNFSLFFKGEREQFFDRDHKTISQATHLSSGLFMFF